MKVKNKPTAANCPVTSASLSDVVFNTADELVQYCQTSEATFGQLEVELATRVAMFGCLLTQLFLAARHERLDVNPFLEDGRFRPCDDYAERTLMTRFGTGSMPFKGASFLPSTRTSMSFASSVK